MKYRAPAKPLRVTIEAELDAGGWIIGVRDNGIGISSKFHDQIFSPFKRLHGGEIPGSGIGLALCRRIVELHGGRIWIKSEEGQGTAVLFNLPSAASTPA